MSVTWEVAWRRAVEAKHPFITGKKKSDFRSLDYIQNFQNIPAGSSVGPLQQNFPAGAFVLEISASANVPRVIKPKQYYADGAAAPADSTYDRFPSTTPGNLDTFAVNFSYTNDENITPQGPGMAAAVFGIDGSRFPSRELIIDPSQGILATVANILTFQLISGAAAPAGVNLPISVTLVYKTMVPRAIG